MGVRRPIFPVHEVKATVFYCNGSGKKAGLFYVPDRSRYVNTLSLGGMAGKFARLW